MIGKFFIGIDIGGTKIYGGVVSPSGDIVRTLKTSTPFQASSVVVLGALHQAIAELMKDAGVSRADLLGIGVAVPGVVDPEGRVVVTPNIRLGGVDLKKILIKKYRVLVAVGNDVNLGVLGEHWLGAAHRASNVVGLFPGTGVGGGVIVDGRFMAGAGGAAAELGHMMIDPDGPACTCGNTGCLEAFVGRWAMERDIRAAVKKGEKSVITELAGKDLKQIKSGAFKKALEARDPLVMRVVQRAAEALALACVSINHVFNPQMFLFGGGVIESFGERILPVVENAIRKDPFFSKLTPPKGVYSKLGDDAVMLGAVAAVRQSCAPADQKDAPYYPKLRVTPSGRVMVNRSAHQNTFYVRADGKVREPGDVIVSRLTDGDLEEICKKGPEVFIVASARGKVCGFTPKALKFLRKKHILLHKFPLAAAVRAYAASDDRRAILFNL